MSSNTTDTTKIEADSSNTVNVGTVNDSRLSFEIIRLGIVSISALAGTIVILGSVGGFRTIDPAALALVSSTVTGIIGFLAGRKK